MPNIITIDPTNIPELYRLPLIRFFNETKQLLYTQNDKYVLPDLGFFCFTESLIAWSSLASSKYPSPPQTMCFETFNTTHISARGGQAKVYFSNGTLSIGSKQISFSKTFPRVIKVGPQTHFSQVERELHQFSVSFRCEPFTIVNETAYFIMEKASGVTLDNLLNERVLTVEQRFILAIEIIDATLRIAEREIHHRDIKPQNIIVDLQGKIPHVRIIDFGLAQFAKASSRNESRQSECFEGTFAFAPPERYENISANNSDAYSVAMVLALIFGAVLRPCQPGIEAFLQGLKYATKMDYTNTLVVPGLSTITLSALEAMLSSMSFVNPNLRMNLTTARQELVTIGLSLEAGLHSWHPTETQRNTPRARLPSCWVRRTTSGEGRSLRYNSSLFSLNSQEELDQATPKVSPPRASLSLTCFFLPAREEASPRSKKEPNSPSSPQ